MTESFDTGLKIVAAHYLQLLSAKVTSTSIQRRLEEDPNYPSLLSLSETFDKYNIPNSAFEVAPEDLPDAETPFLAFVTVPGMGKEFVLVVRMDHDSISYRHKRKRIKTIPKEEFLKRYQNVIWIAEPDEYSGDQNYFKDLQQEKGAGKRKVLWYTSLVALLIYTFILNMPPTHLYAFLPIAMLKVLGTTTAILLLAYETGDRNEYIKPLCKAGGHANCDAVLNSKAAKILGVSWAELGFFYFSTTTLLLLLPHFTFEEKTLILAVGNIIAFPYILFSIFYQWKIVKQWCMLCLTVQSILLLELVWNIFNFWLSKYKTSISVSDALEPMLLQLSYCLFISIIGWYGLKSLLVKARDAKMYLINYRRLQYSPEIFQAILLQQPIIHEGWENLGIRIGNEKATNVIVKVCNPYCGPCSKAHPALHDIVRNNKEVQVRIIFINTNSDRGALVSKHFMAIADKGDQEMIQLALDDWYQAPIKDYELFSSKYPMNGELKKQDSKLNSMNKWCTDAEINYTPCLFVNGRRLPQQYDVQELKYFL